MYNKVLYLALSITMISSLNAFTAPSYCNGLECPEFKILTTIEESSTVEIREYTSSRWASTNIISGSTMDKSGEGFMKLFKFISGGNDKQVKIPMTAPVRVEINSKQAFTDVDISGKVSFYLSPKHESSVVPKSSEIFIEEEVRSEIYAVIAFPGYSKSQEKCSSELIKLGSILKKRGIKFDDSKYFFAGYDSPFKLWNRHSEIWIRLIDYSG